MAGDIFVSREHHWSVSSWAFYWAAEFLADNVGDEKAAAWIREVVDEHLMALDLDADFPEPTRTTILRLLATELVPDARNRLPTEDFDRDGALRVLQQLADMAREASN